jgi:hypothetical protein
LRSEYAGWRLKELQENNETGRVRIQYLDGKRAPARPHSKDGFSRVLNEFRPERISQLAKLLVLAHA